MNQSLINRYKNLRLQIQRNATSLVSEAEHKGGSRLLVPNSNHWLRRRIEKACEQVEKTVETYGKAQADQTNQENLDSTNIAW